MSRTSFLPNLLTFSARGVDYPGVTKVIQVGVPPDRNTYIHRVGRTGRAGKLGEANLILAPFEQKFLKELTAIPIKDHELPESELELGKREEKIFKVAQDVVPEGMLEDTYASVLAYCIIALLNLVNGRSKAGLGFRCFGRSYSKRI